MLFKEIVIGLKRRTVYNVSLIILLGITMTLCNIVLQNREARDFERVHYASLWDNSSVYATYDTLYEHRELEKSYFSEKESQFRVQHFVDALDANEEYPYYVCGTHPIEIPDTDGIPIACYYAGEAHLLRAHQINRALQRDFPFSIAEGRTFSEEDFDYQPRDIIPVVLGNTYSGLIEIGTVLEVNYMSFPVKIEVIGIAEKDSYFPLFDSLVYEDDYIMMPMLQATHEPCNDDEDFLQKANLLQNCTGYFRVSQDHTLGDLVTYLNDTITQHGMFEIRLMRVNSGRLLMLSLSSETQRMLYLGIACALTAYSLLSIIMLVYTNTRKNARKYSILYLSGASWLYIASLVLLEALVVAVGALGFSVALSIIIGRGAIKINILYSLMMMIAGALCTIPALRQLFSSSILYMKNY